MARNGVGIGAFCFLGLLVGAACSSDTSSGNAPATGGPTRVVHPDEIRAALKPLADAECQWLFHCCNADERADQLGPATAATDCADRVLQSATVSYTYSLPLRDNIKTVLRELDRLGYGYDYARVAIDGAAVQACAQSISAAACNAPGPEDHCVPHEPPKGDDACAVSKLLVGKQPLGEECAGLGIDCAPGLICAYLEGNQGVCVKAPEAGDTCFFDQDCGQDVVCEWGTGKCVKGAEFDEACSYSDLDHPVSGTEKQRCRAGLVCDTVTLKCSDSTCAGGGNCRVDGECPAGTTCVMNICGKPGKQGASCYKDTDCDGGKCRYDAVAQRQFCALPASDGSTCVQDEDCVSHFCRFAGDGQACAPQQALDAPCPSMQGRECTTGNCQPGATAWVCGPAAVAGATCTSDLQCNPLTKLYCVMGQCTQGPIENGQDCAAGTQCKSEVCTDGKCAAKGRAGAPCGAATTGPCDEGFYCDTGAGDGSAEGTCQQKKPEGAPCVRAAECWGDCRASHGALRCLGKGLGQVTCGG